jgi:hypothetical protein
VLLRGKNGAEGPTQNPLEAEALIEGGIIRIPAALAQNRGGAAWEYVEFLSV